MLYLCALLLVQPVTAIIVPLDQDFTTPVSTGEGGRTLLVEEYTATWCSVCSEVDPERETVADSHGSRIALIALHPTDGDDAFEPAAAAHRIERMKTVNPSIASTPTFVVEGGNHEVVMRPGRMFNEISSTRNWNDKRSLHYRLKFNRRVRDTRPRSSIQIS